MKLKKIISGGQQGAVGLSCQFKLKAQPKEINMPLMRPLMYQNSKGNFTDSEGKVLSHEEIQAFIQLQHQVLARAKALEFRLIEIENQEKAKVNPI